MKRPLLVLVLLVALVVAACSGDDDDTSADTTTTSEQSTTSTTPPVDEPVVVPRVTVSGPEEIVFDWTTDSCEPEHIPDIAARAFRDAGGTVQLSIGHYVNYRMTGPELDQVVTDCTGPVLRSDFDPDPAQFNDSEWIGSPYTLDGQTVYAIVHNEYRGDTHAAARPGQCPSGQRLPCLDTSFTMAVSTDGGGTFSDILPAPDHLVATLPHTYADDTIPTGLRQPSNIIQGPDDFFYLFGNVSSPPVEEQWVCVMRTDDLATPSSWRYWDGDAFEGTFVDPYREPVGDDPDTCAPVDFPALSGSVQESVVWDSSIERYVMVGVSAQPLGAPQWGVYFATSQDLLDWSPRQLLVELPVNPSVNPDDDLFHAYPSILDPDSASRNFETTDGGAYLYLARLNAGGNSLDRDLVRWPIEIALVEVQPPGSTPPEWSFDSGADLDAESGGWAADNNLTPLDVRDGRLVTRSTGDDPWMVAGPLVISSANDLVTISMQVSGAGEIVTGQLFFVTDEDLEVTESKSITFDVVADGSFHDYELDVGARPGWVGVITGLRLDPVPDADRDIEIDRIGFSS